MSTIPDTTTIYGNPGAGQAWIAVAEGDEPEWIAGDSDIEVVALPHGGSIAQITIKSFPHDENEPVVATSVEVTPEDVDHLIEALTRIRATVQPEA